MKPIVPRTRAASGRLDEKVAFLTDARHYPHRPRVIWRIETHFAWIFLAGERAYKLKKPLHQASMDYRTVALRERACRAELELNRRLAPDVYRRIVPLGRARDGRLALRAGAGQAVDWLVQMRRLPAARMLDQAIAERSVGVRDLEPVVARLAAFFRSAERRPMTDRAYRAHMRAEIRHSARALLAPDLALQARRVKRVMQLQLAWLARHRQLLDGRGAMLRDGHGDLRPEHVFLGTARRAACVIDCLEFDARLRRLDPAEEMAFLAMECARLGATRLGRDLLARYAQAMDDSIPQPLIEFYMSRRAMVRAQIAAWHVRDPEFAGHARQWRARAYSYLNDALRYVRRANARD